MMHLYDNIISFYPNLDDDQQQLLWNQAIASYNTYLLHGLLPFCSSSTLPSLAKLTKELLTHADKHKVPELWYNVQVNK
jgi:hypothetical protein